MCGDHKYPIRPFEGSCDKIWPTGAFLGPPKSPKGPFGAKTSPFRAPLGPKGARYQVKVCVDHEFNPGGPIGGSWDQICPPWTLRGSPGPQKGTFGARGGPERALFRPERPFWGLRRSKEGPGGPDLVPTALKWSYGVKLMVTTHFDLISGPLRVPRGPKGVSLDQSINFHVPIFWGILFVSNIGLWGVQSIAAECSAHPALL